jgi:hypothetical protein
MHEHQEKELAAPKTEVPWYAAVDESLKALLTSKSFWMLALAHSMAFVCRGTDRVLGTFFHDIAHLPRKSLVYCHELNSWTDDTLFV